MSSCQKSVLLTGATGFLGSHILELLVSRGHKVSIIKRSFSDTWRINAFMDNVQYFDIDKVEIDSIFNTYYDAIIHTATIYERDDEQYSDIVNANILFPLLLLDAARKHKISTFINTDSFITRGDNYQFLQGYALTKRQLVEWLDLASQEIRVLNLRLEHLYGTRDSCNKFVIKIINNLLAPSSKIKLTQGKQLRDFIYCTDAAHAYILALEKADKFSNGTHHLEVGTGKAVSIKEFVEMAKDLTNSSNVLEFGAIPYRENEIMSSKADISSLIRLGWKPQTSLEQGLENTIRWMKEENPC
jgi:CDP-paratose synthetase